MVQRALPYRTPSEAVVTAKNWFLVIDDGEIPLPEALPHWDYQTDLTLRREVQIDLDRALAESRLAPGTELALAAVWTATGSKLKGTAARTTVRQSGSITLETHLPGSDLGGVLVLDTALVLAKRRVGADRPVAARRAGSVLWGDRRQMRLQGDAPQFPMAVIDFAKTNYSEGAAWHLDIGTNLEAATMGSLLLLVNESKNIAAEALKNAGNPRLQDKIVLSMIYGDIARVMVEHALSLPDFNDDMTVHDETLGATLLELFGRLFPDRSIEDVRLRAQQSPSLFASELQSAVRIFEDVE